MQTRTSIRLLQNRTVPSLRAAPAQRSFTSSRVVCMADSTASSSAKLDKNTPDNVWKDNLSPDEVRGMNLPQLLTSLHSLWWYTLRSACMHSRVQ
jgi:hypothetical protein